MTRRTIRIKIDYSPLPLQGYRDQLRLFKEYVGRVSHDDNNPLTVPLLLGIVEQSIERQDQLLELIEMVERERDEVIAEIRPKKPWERLGYATAYGYEIAQWTWCINPGDARKQAQVLSEQLMEGDGHVCVVIKERAHIFSFPVFPENLEYIWQ